MSIIECQGSEFEPYFVIPVLGQCLSFISLSRPLLHDALTCLPFSVFPDGVDLNAVSGNGRLSHSTYISTLIRSASDCKLTFLMGSITVEVN